MTLAMPKKSKRTNVDNPKFRLVEVKSISV